MKSLALLFILGAWAVGGCNNSTRYGLALGEATLDSNPPTLSWERFPSPEGGEFRDVTYELRVIREQDGRVVFSRKGLTTTRYTLDDPLDPAENYRWSVRPWFVFRDEIRVGPWAQRLPEPLHPGQTVVPVPVDYFARIVTSGRQGARP